MLRAIRTLLLLTLLFFATAAEAHYNMLLPATASTKKGEGIALVYQWGHPFEHQLFEAPAPQSLVVFGPDGKKVDLTKSLKAVTNPDKKTIGSYRTSFTPQERGDYVFVLTAPANWMEEEQEFFHDTVKVVLHVQAQKGWDTVVGHGFEMVPMTRPYGLQPGMVYQTQALLDGKPVPGALVEVERYNPIAPKDLPADEHITRSMKTDPNGVATCTLTEPGWWCITAQRDGGKKDYKGKMYPVKQRATLWVFVDEKAK